MCESARCDCRCPYASPDVCVCDPWPARYRRPWCWASQGRFSSRRSRRRWWSPRTPPASRRAPSNRRRATRASRGNRGPVGEQGPQGEQGIQGRRGPPGNAGVPGEQGIPGPPGEPGAEGEQGPEGIPGPEGPQRARGAARSGRSAGCQRGCKGRKGRQGPQGPRAQGPEGPAGADGRPGQDGDDGARGPAGPEGPTTTSVVRATQEYERVPAGEVLPPVTAACPATRALVGGGGSVVLDSEGESERPVAPAVLVSSRPDDVENPRAWVVTAVAVRGAPVTVEAFAVCGPVQDGP